VQSYDHLWQDAVRRQARAAADALRVPEGATFAPRLHAPRARVLSATGAAASVADRRARLAGAGWQWHLDAQNQGHAWHDPECRPGAGRPLEPLSGSRHVARPCPGSTLRIRQLEHAHARLAEAAMTSNHLSHAQASRGRRAGCTSSRRGPTRGWRRRPPRRSTRATPRRAGRCSRRRRAARPCTSATTRACRSASTSTACSARARRSAEAVVLVRPTQTASVRMESDAWHLSLTM
jgi:hypothetical protein